MVHKSLIRIGLFVAGLLVSLLMATIFGWCNRNPEERPVSGTTTIERRVDTVVRIVERPPVRVVVSPPIRTVENNVEVDTLLTQEGVVYDTAAVEQVFQAMFDTVVGRDTIHGVLTARARSPTGPITMQELRAEIAMMAASDTLALEQTTTVIEVERIREIHPSLMEKVGWAGAGVLIGTTATAIVILATKD